MPAWRRSFCWRRRWRRPARSATELAGAAGELIYWHLTGGYEPGEVRTLFKGDAAGDRRGRRRPARDNLGALIDAYDEPRPLLPVAAAPGPRAALLRLRPAGPRGRMGRGGRGSMMDRKAASAEHGHDGEGKA